MFTTPWMMTEISLTGLGGGSSVLRVRSGEKAKVNPRITLRNAKHETLSRAEHFPEPCSRRELHVAKTHTRNSGSNQQSTRWHRAQSRSPSPLRRPGSPSTSLLTLYHTANHCCRPSKTGPRPGAKVIKPKKAKLIQQEKIKKKSAAGLVGTTEKFLAEKAGHLEILRGGKKDKKDGAKK